MVTPAVRRGPPSLPYLPCSSLPFTSPAPHGPQDKIKDRLGLQELRAVLLLRLGRRGEAAEVYRALLGLNPNNTRMHAGLREALGLQAAEGEGGEGAGGSLSCNGRWRTW